MAGTPLTNSAGPGGWRVRFAPSPTGALHVGTVRTALFAWLAARHTGGTFILRIEDTDQERFVPGSATQITESLRWLGLHWDEGPDIGGPYAPYVQSERSALYREHGDLLVQSGNAYWCTCTPERLAAMRTAQQAAKLPTRYDRHCLNRQDAVATERAAGTSAVLRLRMPDGRTEWDDAVSGHLAFENTEIDDQVLLKGDGFPTYHLAVVVDDHFMAMTHVIRAVEWIPSTPKHLALYAAFGWTPPIFAHVPNVLADDGKLKLSKRRGAKFILEYRDLGYLPDAMVNAMALLGWSSGTEKETFTRDELIEAFTLERVHPAGAVFDEKRLDSLNGLHIRALSPHAFAELITPWLPQDAGADRVRELGPMLQERIVHLGEVRSLAAPLLGAAPWADDVEFPPKKVDRDAALALLRETVDAVQSGGLADIDALRGRLTAFLEGHNLKARDGFRTLYIAILGRSAGVPVFDAMRFIGAEQTVERLHAAEAKLSPV